jgi:hypothetical protein
MKSEDTFQTIHWIPEKEKENLQDSKFLQSIFDGLTLNRCKYQTVLQRVHKNFVQC